MIHIWWMNILLLKVWIVIQSMTEFILLRGANLYDVKVSKLPSTSKYFVTVLSLVGSSWVPIGLSSSFLPSIPTNLLHILIIRNDKYFVPIFPKMIYLYYVKGNRHRKCPINVCQYLPPPSSWRWEEVQRPWRRWRWTWSRRLRAWSGCGRRSAWGRCRGTGE